MRPYDPSWLRGGILAARRRRDADPPVNTAFVAWEVMRFANCAIQNCSGIAVKSP